MQVNVHKFYLSNFRKRILLKKCVSCTNELVHFQAKKKAAANDSGLTLEQRKARDAEIMRLKQEKKLEEAKAKEATGAGKAPAGKSK